MKKLREYFYSSFKIAFLTVSITSAIILFLLLNPIYDISKAFGTGGGPDTVWDHGQNDSEYRPLSDCQKDITGKWAGNDGGTYYIRQFNGNYGPFVGWFGSNTFKEGEGFSNVFHGARHDYYGKSLWGDWSDVPMGLTSASGTMFFYITESGTKIFKTGSNGDFFGGSEFTRLDHNCK